MWLTVIFWISLKNVWPDFFISSRSFNLKKTAAVFSLLLILSPSFSWGQTFPEQALQSQLKASVAHRNSFYDRFEADVWLTDMSSRLRPFIDSDHRRVQLLRLIHQEATLAKLPPDLVLALIETESSFDRFAVSAAGAQGLMQVMPFWKKVIGRPDDNLTDIATNLRYGNTILSYYLEKEEGNMTRALARYNGSLGKTWYPERVYKNWDRNWR